MIRKTITIACLVGASSLIGSAAFADEFDAKPMNSGPPMMMQPAMQAPMQGDMAMEKPMMKKKMMKKKMMKKKMMMKEQGM